MHASAPRALGQHPGLLNNHYVRSLLGPGVYSLPLGGVLRRHLRRAKRVLSGSFELVLPLSELHSAAASTMLRWVMCWRETNVTEVARAQGRASEFGRVALLLEHAQDLRRHNELDAELFEHARAIFEADRRYFEALLHDGRAGAGRRENCVCSARSWQL